MVRLQPALLSFFRRRRRVSIYKSYVAERRQQAKGMGGAGGNKLVFISKAYSYTEIGVGVLSIQIEM